MASNRPGPETPFIPQQRSAGSYGHPEAFGQGASFDGYGPGYAYSEAYDTQSFPTPEPFPRAAEAFGGGGPLGDADDYGTPYGDADPFRGAEPFDKPYGRAEAFGDTEEWNPTEDSLVPVRGRHRVSKQRGLARSSTVLGVGVIAAVGAGGIATAQSGKAPVSISVPNLPKLPHMPASVASLLPGHSDDAETKEAAGTLSNLGMTNAEAEQGQADAGEALRARILAQAERQQAQAEEQAKQEAEAAAAKVAAEKAAQEKKDAEAAAEAAKKKAAEEAAKKAEAERLAKLAASYVLPVSSYTITSTFGEAGSMWASGYHTGLDFAAPTGTIIKAIHTGTITEAGWAGSYGYRTILTLDDGTELWFCHQSSINVSVGQKVTTGDVIGRVGATGNVTGPHLHLEVHPNGQATAVDPAPWLNDHGLTF